MKFLIDGQRHRIKFRQEQWADGIGGQLLTPLTRYNLSHKIWAIDNGAFSGFKRDSFRALLKREFHIRQNCLFVSVPDVVGDHKATLELWNKHNYLANNWKKAFVAQDGYDGLPENADALFIGGTDSFKDSDDAISAVKDALAKGKHVHIGRVNGPTRFIKFHLIGAHTCDGSGVSRFHGDIEAIRDEMIRQGLTP